MTIFVSSQVRGYQKFMAGKNVHSWCGTGSKSPIPTAGGDAKSKIVVGPRSNDVATDETSGGAHTVLREWRSPP